MGTEILYPQDILIERLRFNPPSFSPHKNSNPNPKSSYRKEYRKRSPPPKKSEPLVSKKSTVPALGQVTILKRGENLDLKSKKDEEESLKKIFFSDDLKDLKERRKDNLRKSFSGDLQSFSSENLNLKKTFSGDLLLGGTQRLGPDPELVSVRLNDLKLGSDHVYAGSAFASSPSPRKLPLPKFSMKKEGGLTAAVEESATKDLRRLLRLE